MSLQEGQPGDPSHERETAPYVRAARFSGEQPAGEVYQALQQTIFVNQCDLSVYRLNQLDHVWFVAIVGQPPVPELDGALREILATGEAASLPSNVIDTLLARRVEATHRGPWVERHYRTR